MLRGFLLPALAFVACACAPSADTSAGVRVVAVPQAQLAAADRAMRGLVEEGSLAGAILAVAHRGETVHLQSFGMLDRESGLAMRDDAIFRIYSMTKPVTTAAALMLVEEGRLELDQPVARYLPELGGLRVHGDPAAPEREMTVRDLMRHTSGLTYGIFGDTEVDALYREAKPLESRDLAELITRLAELPLLCAPGSCWNYGVSTDVLGRIVEVRSGSALDVFFEQKIFRPLGMNDTGFHVPPEKLERFAALYGTESGSLDLLDAPATSRYAAPPTLHSGGGGLVSTAADYLRFLQMIANGGRLDGVRLLRPETVAEMTRNQLPEPLVPIAVTRPRPGLGFGLGFAVRLAESPEDPGAVVGEYGWDGLASTHSWVSPRHGLIAVTLEQTMPYGTRASAAVKAILYEAFGG